MNVDHEELMRVAKRLVDHVLPLPDSDVELMASILVPMKAEKGEVIIRLGQVNDSMLFVTKGLARQFYFKNGHDITEHFTCEYQLLYCIESLFLQQPTELLAEALEPLEYYKIPYFKLKSLITQAPNLAKWIIKWFEIDSIISQKKADTMRFESAKERYERFVKEYPEAAKRAPIQHIASYLIMTRESMSRVRSGKL